MKGEARLWRREGEIEKGNEFAMGLFLYDWEEVRMEYE